MKKWKSQSHVMWDCKYHLVFITKYRQRAIYGKLKKKIGGIIRDLCRQKSVELHEGHAMPDHIHLLLSIPPKFSVANTVGFIKGKSAIRIHRELLGTKRMTDLSFWATGYCASTVGLDEEKIRKDIQHQDKFDKNSK
jgi:REP-associated tyrosine transposase